MTTYRDTDEWVTSWWVVPGVGDVIVVEQGHDHRLGWEGDSGGLAFLFDVDDGMVHLGQREIRH